MPLKETSYLTDPTTIAVSAGIATTIFGPGRRAQRRAEARTVIYNRRASQHDSPTDGETSIPPVQSTAVKTTLWPKKLKSKALPKRNQPLKRKRSSLQLSLLTQISGETGFKILWR